ncbi:PTS sugar transporter subunit IIA [Demequina sp. NBRC 110052]|uniref:PTS sugar transporter subunit IIA n=1 Tax=Demequina sp. NBRC 110052 TaxID=1570341 RepID=UPI0009FD1132|nr:PTS sugar transporter subunit IIA [Demequina sp. NBRC 110052]
MTSALATALPIEAVRVGVDASSWREALIAAGELLESSGCVTSEYTEQMVAAVESLGPYIVVAPGIALGHARPGPAVLKTGLSLAVLAAPVEFGHDSNDPVRLVLGLSAVDHDSHVGLMAQLAGLLAERAVVESLTSASTASAARAILVGS